MFDHDLPREQVVRLDKLIDLLAEIRDRLPAKPADKQVPTSGGGPQSVQLREPDGPGKRPDAKPTPAQEPVSEPDPPHSPPAAKKATAKTTARRGGKGSN